MIRFPSIDAAVASGLCDTFAGFTQLAPLTRRKVVQSEVVVMWIRTWIFETAGADVVGGAALVGEAGAAVPGLDGPLQLTNAITTKQAAMTANFDE